MKRDKGFLLFLFAVVALIAAGSLTTPSTAPQATAVAPVATSLAPATFAASPVSTCTADAPVRIEDPDAVKPGCCSTQCNVDKDCDKICGKGNCACIQENPCCRRCVY
jgi:hypothetical protein